MEDAPGRQNSECRGALKESRGFVQGSTRWQRLEGCEIGTTRKKVRKVTWDGRKKET